MKTWTVALFIVLTGCAHHRIEPYSVTPRPLPRLLRAQIGTVAVTSTNVAPVFEFRAPDSKSTAVAVGMGAGLRGGGLTTAGGVASLSETRVGGEGGAFLIGSAVVVGAAAGTVGVAAGTMNGLITGVSPAKSRQIEAVLATAASRPELQENLRAEVVKRLRATSTSPSDFRVAESLSSDSGLDGSQALSKSPVIDSLLELRIQQIKVAALRTAHSPLTLDVSATVSLVRVRDGSVLYEGSVGYESTTDRLTDWSRNNGKPFHAELERCTRSLAAKIANVIMEDAPH